jgi:hypothetical protein
LFFKGRFAKKSGRKLSKMKKITKKTKNFQKGYLQNGFYMINYGKNQKGAFCAPIK